MASKLDTLTHQQLQVVHHLLKGHNIFLTGGGGVGKSYLLSVIYNELPALKKQFDSLQSPYSVPKLPRIQITAMTGCAALLLGNKAKTLHSWSGIKLGKGTVNELFVRIRRSPKSMRNWLCTDLLIIDEVSMLTAELLDKLNQLAKKLRSNQKPFGGIQVMFVGDFYQLPPVNKTDEKTIFAFESDAWKEIIHTSIELTIIQRQKDEIFQKVLTEARFGNLSKESCKILRERQGLEWRQNKIRPTLLFPRRAEVDMINESNLRALQGKRYYYKAKLLYDGLIPDNFNETDENFVRALKQYDNDAPYLLELELAMDTQVMLIANMDMNLGLVNGSRGVVVGFCPATELPIVEFVNGMRKTIGNHSWPIEEYEFISRSQVPLRLAYACTIHKCISGDTLLSIPDMGLIQIKDLEVEEQKINSIHYPKNKYVSGLCENKQIIEVYKGYIEDGIKLESSYGYEIITSDRHPLLVYNIQNHTFEWKKTPDIQINNYIIIKKGTNSQGNYYPLNNILFNGTSYKKYISIPNFIGEDFGYLLGLFIGDGSINNKSYRFDFISMDYDIIKKCTDILDKLFGINLKISKCNGRKTDTWKIWFYSKQLVELLSHIGYNFGIASTKIIPYTILQSPISVQKAILRGLYDTDGGVSNSTINFTTTSYILGKQMQQMLLNIGILVSRNVLHNEDVSKNHSKSYRLNISGYSAIEFNNEIGFGCERKKIQSDNRFHNKSSIRLEHKSQAFEIPNGDILIKKLRDEMYNGQKRLNKKQITTEGNRVLSNIINKMQKLRCISLHIIISSIPNIDKYPTGKFLKFIYDNGIIVDTIKSKTIVPDIQMYDIGVNPINTSGYLPDGHDFIAGGFINHNCQGSTLDSALVDIGSSTFEFGQAYVALSRCRSLEALYIYDFDPVSFRAHPKVKQFYENLILLPLSEQDQLLIKSSTDILNKEAFNPENKQITSSVSEEVRAINIIKTDPEEFDEKELKDQPGQVQPSTNWLYNSIPSHWKSYLSKCESKLNILSEKLVNSKKEFFPSRENMWSALDFTPLDSIKVVILGQDPYPTPGNAHGLAFSVLPDVKPLPASLKNIYKEIQSDLNMPSSTNGYLESWARQGILLLNTVLTVEAGQPQSHSKIGWEEITDEILKIILEHTRQTIFVLWGKSAQSKKKLIDTYYNYQHRTFESAHPSPLSASKGFFGSKPFSTINNWLQEYNKSIIQW